MRLEPRIAGGDWAISSSGRSKLKSDTRKTGRFSMVICGVLDGEMWCDCGDLCGRFLRSKIFLFSQLFFVDWASSTERSSAAWTEERSGGTGRVQATVTREKGLGIRKRSQERSSQARWGNG